MARRKPGEQEDGGTSDDAIASAAEETPTDPGLTVADLTDGEGAGAFPGDDSAEPTRPGVFVASLEREAGEGVPVPVDLAGDATGPLEAPFDEAAMESNVPPEEPFEFASESAVELGQDSGQDVGQVLDFARAREEAEEAAAGGEGGETTGEEGDLGRVPFEKLEGLIEAMLFASDKPLGVAELKRLTGERDTRLLNQAIEALIARRKDSGLTVVSVAGAFSLRTNPMFADWVSKLVAGKPVRLSRAMLETLAIVAYRQPITRPEIDDVRGVDCGPVLKTLLDRNLVRIIGKSEEVGRPMLYGTTSEFLRIFSLKDLTQLPTLRQFHELSAENQAKVEEAHPAPLAPAGEASSSIVGVAAAVEPLASPGTAPDPGEDDRLMAELEEASEAANRAAGPLAPETPPLDSQDS